MTQRSVGVDRTQEMVCRRVHSVAQALDVGRGDLVSLVGGGGKTTLMYRLAKELGATGLHVAVATTTKIERPRMPGFALLACPGSCEDLQVRLAEAAVEIPVLGRSILPSGKVDGIPAEWCDQLMAEGAVDVLIVEADGAARRPVKAPEAWEPVVPARTTTFVALLGLSCLGKPLDEETVFRLRQVSAVTGLGRGAALVPRALCRLLAAEEGLLKGKPPGARALAFLNQKDVPGTEEPATEVARCLLGRSRAYERVVVGALRLQDVPLDIWSR